MKKIFILLSVVAFAALVLSCTKTETTPQFMQSSASFTVTPSSTTVAITPKDSVNTALSFTWTDPKFSAGLAQTKFTVYASKTGSNFSSFLTKGFTGVLTGALTGKEINSFALRFGGTVGQPIDLDMKVIASLVNNDQVVGSSTMKITVTPFDDLTLWSSSSKVVCTAATADQTGDTLTWTSAFVGYNGHITYQIQYAKGGTSFASPVSIAVTSLSKIFTKLDLNKIANGVGLTPGTPGNVDFRIKATNDASQVLYSNTATISITSYVSYNSIGIIGDATAGSWSTDTDMRRPDPINNPSAWTATLYLTGGKGAKFRADDDWATNWGDAAFPTGTATQGGANIAVTNSGYYKIDFNAGSGVYTFTPLTPTTYTNISLIGDFNSWGADTDLTVDASGHVWTGTVTIAAAGGIKFRANHDWATNWGNKSFPSGYSTQNGDNIAITAGSYFVYFNDLTGEYFFGSTTNNTSAGSSSAYTQIGAIGDFNSWSADANLTQDPTNKYKWSGKLTFNASGGVKFRANAAWATSWGGSTFPNGQGTTQNDPNITVAKGVYQITFNTATGEYTFVN